MKLLPIVLFFVAFQLSAQYTDSIQKRISSISSPLKQAQAYNDAADRAWNSGNYREAVELADKGLFIARENNFKSEQAKLLNNKGIAFDYLAEYPSALKCYYTALSIEDKLDDPKTKADILGNIGLIYTFQMEHDKARSYHTRALEIRKNIGDVHGISASLNNLAIVFNHEEKFREAIKLYEQCIEMDAAAEDIVGLGDDYNNIALCYIDLKQFDTALEFLGKSLEIRKKTNDPKKIAQSLTSLATIYQDQGNHELAEQVFLESIPLAKMALDKESLKYIYQRLFQNSETLGDTIQAYKYFELHIAYRDSIDNSEIGRLQAESEMNYLFQKEKELTQIRQAEKERYYKQLIWIVSGGLLIILFFAVLLFKRWKQSLYQKRLIEEKSELLEEKNQEILDSINYAQRIQNAILPKDDFLRKVFREHTIFYQPKDIVSGDFYWVEEKENHLFFGVADCTGHGVPGAIVSVICHNALDIALTENRDNSPAEILHRTRELVVDELSSKSSNVQDGMDISLCVVNRNTGDLTWSGANRPLWIYRQAEGQIEEIRGTKQPIGQTTDPQPFEEHLVKLDKNDRIYLFSDGITDQFGGPNDKKIMTKGLRNWILESSSLSVSEQGNFIKQSFSDWKKQERQTDDISMLIAVL